MNEVETGRFTVAVFQDVAWAQKGLQRPQADRVGGRVVDDPGQSDPAVATLIQQTLGFAGEPIELASVGPVLGHGPLLEPLQGSANDLGKLGLAGTMRRVGFQAHDARIFETLTGRGGVLVAIRSEPRAADALAILHSYGGGNAAIGAWTGRV